MGRLRLFARLRALGTLGIRDRDKRRRTLPRQRTLGFEALEARWLLSGAPFNYTATNADALRLVIVGATLQLRDDTANSILQAAPLASTSSVTINGYAGGNQALDVDFGGGAFNLAITVNAKGSGNRLLVDDHADTAAGVAYTVGSSTVAVGSTVIAFSGNLSNGLAVQSGSGGDSATINNAIAQAPVSFSTSSLGATSVFVGGNVTGSLANVAGNLTLNTHASDSITFLDNASSALASYSLTATGLVFNGVNIPYATAASLRLATSTYAGEAVFVASLPAATTHVTLSPSAGHISMIVSPAALASPSARTIDAALTAASGAGDLVTVDDSTDTASGVQYVVTKTSVTVGNTTVNYAASASGGLVINTGKGTNGIVVINSTSFAVPVAVNTSGVNPTSLYVGGIVTGSLANIAGPLTLQTHTIDAIVFNDNATTSVVNYHLLSNYLQWNSSIIGYAAANSIVVATSHATGDTLFVMSLPTLTGIVTLAPGGMNTSIIISPDALHGSHIIDAITAVPTGSNTSVTVDDSTSTANTTYTITNSGVSLSGGAVVEYGARDTGGLVINTGRGNDTVNVVQTLAQVPVAINTSGAFRTTIYVGGDNSSITGSLAAIAGPLTLHTTTVDALLFLDNASAASATYTLSAGSLLFNNRIIGFTTAVAIDLYTSTVRDTVTVTSLPALLRSLALHVNNSGGSPGTVITLKAGAFTSSLQRTIDVLSFIPAGAIDYLTVDDSADAANGVFYNLTANVIKISQGGPGFTSVLYSSNLQALALLTGSGAGDMVTVAATSAPMNIATSATTSTSIYVGFGNLNGISAALTFQANGAHDQLTIDDSANTVGANYDLQGGGLTRGAVFIGYTFQNFTPQSLTVLAGSGMNSVKVENLPATETVNLTINKNDAYTKLATALGTVNLTKRP